MSPAFRSAHNRWCCDNIHEVYAQCTRCICFTASQPTPPNILVPTQKYGLIKGLLTIGLHPLRPKRPDPQIVVRQIGIALRHRPGAAKRNTSSFMEIQGAPPPRCHLPKKQPALLRDYVAHHHPLRRLYFLGGGWHCGGVPLNSHESSEVLGRVNSPVRKNMGTKNCMMLGTSSTNSAKWWWKMVIYPMVKSTTSH